jgi:hypothetical protein
LIQTLRALRLLFAIFAVKGFCVCVKKKTLTAKHTKNFREGRREKPNEDSPKPAKMAISEYQE